MEIRDTDLEDAEKLAGLIDSVARERSFLAGTVGFPVDATRAFIASLKSSGGVQVVGVESGELVGWCDLTRLPFEGMTHVGRLGMGVRKDHRSRGLGRKLLEAVVHRAQKSGVQRIELEVFATNHAAIALYASTGFELEGRKIAARRLDGVVDDLLIYARQLPK